MPVLECAGPRPGPAQSGQYAKRQEARYHYFYWDWRSPGTAVSPEASVMQIVYNKQFYAVWISLIAERRDTTEIFLKSDQVSSKAVISIEMVWRCYWQPGTAVLTRKKSFIRNYQLLLRVTMRHLRSTAGSAPASAVQWWRGSES